MEEIADGFLILNQKNEILFFNEVLLRMIKWKSKDVFDREKELLRFLNAQNLIAGEAIVSIPDTSGKDQRFKCAAFRISSQDGSYLLLRIKPDLEDENLELFKVKKNFDLVFNNIGDAILNVSLNGDIIIANPAFYSLIGASPADPPASIRELYVYRDELDDKMVRLLEQDNVFNLETHLYTIDGAIKRVLDSSWIVRDERGIVTGYTAQFKDITYLKNIESRLLISERNFTILFDTILSSIIIVDPKGYILNINTTAEKIYGYSWEDIVGEQFDMVFKREKSQPSFFRVMNLVDQNDGKYVESEVRRTNKSGEIIYTFASYSSIKDSTGEVIAYSVVEKDLSERIKLENKLRESLETIKDTQEAAILGFARLTEYRDKDTGKHLERIREYTRVLAAFMRENPKYKDYITDRYLDDLSLSSTLHDVGKVGIEDHILLKPGKLDQDEFKRIKDHVILGGDALGSVDSRLKQESFLTMGKEIAYYHHERWDGNGSPEGKKGDEIPFSARIVAIADVYDALTSKRPYKEPFSHEEAVSIISQGSGTQFDPEITDCFVRNNEVFKRIKMFIEFEENPSTINDIIDSSQRGRKEE
jgi:PAS domain S-box-containing protein